MGAVIVLGLIASSCSSAPSTDPSGRPTAVLTPSSATYHSGQTISVSVGPNKYFAPFARIIILQCADPGGTSAHLPINDTTCDGNTVAGHSVLVAKDGSFSTAYQEIFTLPNAQLGETPDGLPVCNRTHACVLYIGQDQTNFTQPKIFSTPFTVTPSGGGS
jgi:hypothetical protein